MGHPRRKRALWVALAMAFAGCSEERQRESDAPALDMIVRDIATADFEAGSDRSSRPDLGRPNDGGVEVLDSGSGDDAGDGGTTVRCEPLPTTCAFPVPAEHYAMPIDGCGFALQLTADPMTDARLDAIAAAGGGYVTLDEIDLNRDAVSSLSSWTEDRLQNHDHFGFRWNSGDASTLWYPQAITGEQDAGIGGPRRLLVGWYDNDPVSPEKGVRISLVNLNNPQAIRYRHLLLVETSGAGEISPVLTASGGSLHAGGMVWFGEFLYVADTRGGFRVFDLSRIIEATRFDDGDRLGVLADGIEAFNYRYIVPEVARYELHDASCDVKFSFVGLDRTHNPPLLVSGEYHASRTDGLIVRWALDPASGWLAEEGALVRGFDGFVSGQDKVQGALTVNGALYTSCSSQTSSRPPGATSSTWGRLYYTTPETACASDADCGAGAGGSCAAGFSASGRTETYCSSKYAAWVYGAEDLYYEASENRVWTPSEFPDFRDTVSIPLVVP